jgi:hypothetical protein
MELSLEKRPCRIGVSINTRREMHGEEPVPAMDIPLTNILLDKGELNALLGDKFAHDSLYTTKASKPAEPTFARSLKPFSVIGKFANSRVVIWVGLKPEMLELAEVKLVKLKLEPQVGGLTALALTVQTIANDGETQLLQFLDSSADVAIDFGEPVADAEEAQDELSLEHGTPVKREKVDTASRKRKPDDGATVN